MAAKTTDGPVYFNVDLPKQANPDSQARYEAVVDDHKDLLKKLHESVSALCIDGDCDSLSLLVRAIAYVVQSGQQIIIDSKVCMNCHHLDCSAAGSCDGVVHES